MEVKLEGYFRTVECYKNGKYSTTVPEFEAYGDYVETDFVFDAGMDFFNLKIPKELFEKMLETIGDEDYLASRKMEVTGELKVEVSFGTGVAYHYVELKSCKEI